MGDDDLYEGKVITDIDGNQYMAKKIEGEYVLKLIWKAPKGQEPKKSKLEDKVESYRGGGGNVMSGGVTTDGDDWDYGPDYGGGAGG